MTEITFDQIKVGDRIKTREVYKNGDTFDGEFTVTDVMADFVYSEYRVFHKYRSDRESLTIERAQMSEPERIGTVVEYTRNGVTHTVVKYSNSTGVTYPWILSTGDAMKWAEILAYDPNPRLDTPVP